MCRAAVLDQRRVAVGRLPSPQNVLLEAHRVVQRVHREGVLGRALDAEEGDLCAECEDEVVVAERLHLLELDLALSRSIDLTLALWTATLG